MASRRDHLILDLDRLIADGEALLRGLAEAAGQITREELRAGVKEAVQRLDAKAKEEGKPKPKGRIDDRVDTLLKKWVLTFHHHYETWYSEALAVITQVLPDRTDDFRSLYKIERRKEIDFASYTLSDYQIGLRITRGYENLFDPDSAAVAKFSQQLNIVRAAKAIFGSRLVDISAVLQADIFESELDAARELLKNGYDRAAGVVAGVVLEEHLGQIAKARRLTVRSKSPTISTYNDALKDASAIDVPTWRFIQRLGDIRNLCGHAGSRDPTRSEVSELIDGVDRVTKTVN